MKKNYLSKVAINRDQKEHKKLNCKAVVWLAYKRSMKQRIVTCKAVIKEISQRGAVISVNGEEVPDHFYIVIGNNEHAMACAVVSKESNQFTVEFIKEQPQRLIEAFAMLSIPMAPLYSFMGLMRNTIMQEKVPVSPESPQ